MEISMTKMSQNGQIVIPSEIRLNAKLKPTDKFLVFNIGKNVILKQIGESDLNFEVELMQKISKAENQIKNNQSIKAKTSMSGEEILNILSK